MVNRRLEARFRRRRGQPQIGLVPRVETPGPLLVLDPCGRVRQPRLVQVVDDHLALEIHDRLDRSVGLVAGPVDPDHGLAAAGQGAAVFEQAAAREQPDFVRTLGPAARAIGANHEARRRIALGQLDFRRRPAAGKRLLLGRCGTAKCRRQREHTTGHQARTVSPRAPPARAPANLIGLIRAP
jgi:hypothetical protein